MCMTMSAATSREGSRCSRKGAAQLEPCLQAMHQQALWYTQYGLMAGSVFEEILEDLRAAGLSQEAAVVDLIMYNRTAVGVTFESFGPCPPKPGISPGPAADGRAYAGTVPNVQCLVVSACRYVLPEAPRTKQLPRYIQSVHGRQCRTLQPDGLSLACCQPAGASHMLHRAAPPSTAPPGPGVPSHLGASLPGTPPARRRSTPGPSEHARLSCLPVTAAHKVGAGKESAVSEPA